MKADVDWNSAMPARNKPKDDFSFGKPKNKGIFPAYFIGTTATWEGTCYTCRGTGMDPQGSDGAWCKKCKGGKTVNIGLKYRKADGSVEQEQLNFKLTAPNAFTNKNGEHVVLSASKLYERYSEFSGIVNALPQQLAAWAEENQHTEIPVTIVVKDNSTKTALKITEVQLREDEKKENWQPSKPVVEDELNLEDEIPF